jgi:hypothetical protein
MVFFLFREMISVILKEVKAQNNYIIYLIPVKQWKKEK